MAITQADINRAVVTAQSLESQGYFERARAGDQRAASYFARLVAYKVNGFGRTDDFGWLRKTAGGANVDGYAEDSIVFGADPHDLLNVIDLVNGAGAPGASVNEQPAPNPRREQDIWEAPKPLTEEELAYLLAGGAPIPEPVPPPAIPSYEELGGDEGAKKISRVLGHDYRAAGRPGLDDDCGNWLRRTDYDFMSGKVTPVDASIAKHRDEWLHELTLIRETPHGAGAILQTCRICGATEDYPVNTPRQRISHAPDCQTRTTLAHPE